MFGSAAMTRLCLIVRPSLQEAKLERRLLNIIAVLQLTVFQNLKHCLFIIVALFLHAYHN